jgi:pimeloyl-ACP methyl ester carboxylesterase
MEAVRSDSARRPLFILVHGGMSKPGSALDHNIKLVDSIRDAGYHPLFINWDSALWSAYLDHLVSLRYGERAPLLWGWITSPFIAVGDLAHGAFSAPVVWGAMWADQRKARRSYTDWHQKLVYDSLRTHSGEPGHIRISMMEGDHRIPTPLHLPLLVPTRLVIAPMVDGIGSAAWSSMHRRTKTMFHSEAEFDGHGSAPLHLSFAPATGAVSILMDSVSAVVRTDTARRIVLVGHSMGTIVLNEVLRRYPDLPVTDIVYMAAACSVRDFMESVIPFLEQHPSTQFYNLTLDPRADAAEVNRGGIAPRGSLLEYIDDYLAEPETYLDQTLGKFTHILVSHHVIPNSVRGQVHIKAFGIYDEANPGYGANRRKPMKHGEFNDPDVPFWRRDFWLPTPPASDSLGSMR